MKKRGGVYTGSGGRLALLAGMAVLTGCASAFQLPTPPEPVRYDMVLESVQRPADVRERWGDYTVAPADSLQYRYDDELVTVYVLPARGMFELILENKTGHSLQVVWDQMAFVGADGLTSKVSSGDTRVMDMGRAQTPTVIPSRSRVALSAIPNDYFHRGDYGNTIRDFVCVGRAYQELEGAEMRLLMPIRVQDTVNEYTFAFRLSNIVPPPPPTERQAALYANTLLGCGA